MKTNLKLVDMGYKYLHDLFFKQLEEYEEIDRKQHILDPQNRMIK